MIKLKGLGVENGCVMLREMEIISGLLGSVLFIGVYFGFLLCDGPDHTPQDWPPMMRGF